jgi:hypothetical protein
MSSRTEKENRDGASASHPDCFGDLEIVFPLGADGLRNSPRRCMICVYKTECLRAAMRTGAGNQVQSEMVDRAYDSGMMGFFQRWSRRKKIQKSRLAAAKTGKQRKTS